MKMDINHIYEEYHGKILSYITSRIQNHYMAEDLCHDVFLKICEKINTLDETKASLSTWIYAITRNTLTDYFRCRKVTDEIPETLRSEQNVEDEAIKSETLDLLSKALSQLDERMRDVIILRYYDGKTLREISDAMGLSYAYVKVIQNKALNILKEFLGNE